jgi:hypothetical protein
MAIPYEEKMLRWKQAYELYVSNDFTKKEKEFICKTLILKCIELINEGIIKNEKHIFRSNRDLKVLLGYLLHEKPSFTKIQKELVKKSLENFKVYCILKVQGMKD